MKLLASKWCGDYEGTSREGRVEERQSERERNLSWDPEVRVNLWKIKSLEVCRQETRRKESERQEIPLPLHISLLAPKFLVPCAPLWG